MSQKTVNDRQLDVLAWIAAGCPSDVTIHDSYKVSAAALRNRRLVKTYKRDGNWQAEPTDAGSYFLEHGSYPDGHWGEQQAKRHVTGRQPRSMRSTGKAPVEQMLADIESAGGRLEVDGSARSYWQGLVSSALRYNRVPGGKVLTIERGDTWQTAVLVLADAPDWMTTEARAIPVPTQLRRPHPIIDRIRGGPDPLPMGKDIQGRALRVLEALVREATLRGYGVRAETPADGRHERQQFAIVVRGHDFGLFIDEAMRQIPHEPTQAERRSKERYEHAWIPRFDTVHTGRLRLRVVNGPKVHLNQIVDGKVRRLEDQLGQLMWEIELRANAADERRRLADIAADDRRHRWNQIRAEAQARAQEDRRAVILADQVRRWHEGQRLGAYLEAVAGRIIELPDSQKPAAVEWLTWCRNLASDIDPLRDELQMPVEGEFTAEELTPFMQGLSPYGPALS